MRAVWVVERRQRNYQHRWRSWCVDEQPGSKQAAIGRQGWLAAHYPFLQFRVVKYVPAPVKKQRPRNTRRGETA